MNKEKIIKFKDDLIKYRDLSNQIYRIYNHRETLSDQEKKKAFDDELSERQRLVEEYGTIESEIRSVVGHLVMRIPAFPGMEWDVFDEALSGNFRNSTKGECLDAAIQSMLKVVGKIKQGSAKPIKTSDKVSADVERIKEIMAEVATGNTQIQDINVEYKDIYKELNSYCLLNNLNNPNPHTDLWEFYAYWKENLPSYASRRDYIIKLYRDFGSPKISEKSLSVVFDKYFDDIENIIKPYNKKVSKHLATIKQLLQPDDPNYESIAQLLRTIVILLADNLCKFPKTKYMDLDCSGKSEKNRLIVYLIFNGMKKEKAENIVHTIHDIGASGKRSARGEDVIYSLLLTYILLTDIKNLTGFKPLVSCIDCKDLCYEERCASCIKKIKTQMGAIN